MTADKNRQILLASRPRGEPTPDNFQLVATEVPQPGPGQMVLRTIYLSLDPYMRGRMNAGPSYAKPVEVGEVMEGGTVCAVVTSNLPQYKQGDIVLARAGGQEYALSDGQDVQIIDPSLSPISYFLDVFGMPGMTAYTGLLNIGEPQPGETLVVAAATGAVGSVVGQIAKLKSCRVIGIAGGERQGHYVEEELGFDAYLDHRQPDLAERLQAACPQGIDIYFENVGGAVFDAVLPLLNNFARIPVCGLVAHYSATELPAGPDRVPRVMHNIQDENGILQRQAASISHGVQRRAGMPPSAKSIAERGSTRNRSSPSVPTLGRRFIDSTLPGQGTIVAKLRPDGDNSATTRLPGLTV